MTKAELDAETHALSHQLLELAKRGNVGFVLLLFNGKDEFVATSNLTTEQRAKLVGAWLNEEGRTEESYHRVSGGGQG
jgi:hypothetical protein